MEHLEINLDPRCRALGVDGATFCLLSNLQVGPASPYLAQQAADLREQVTQQIDAIVAAPASRGYQDIMDRLGFPATLHAGRKLAELVARRGLRSISNVVDAYNIVSARSAMPIGAHDAGTIRFPLRLTLAEPGYTLMSFGDTSARPVVPGTLAYVDASGAMLANIGKHDRDALSHAVTERSGAVLLTLIRHRDVSEQDAHRTLSEVVSLLRRDAPAVEASFLHASWEGAA